MNWSLPVSRGVGFSVVTTSASEDVGEDKGVALCLIVVLDALLPQGLQGETKDFAERNCDLDFIVTCVPRAHLRSK